MKKVNWAKKCLELHAEFTRSRGKCERCGSEKNLQCSHVISARYASTRVDPLNSICLCAGCHLWWHDWQIESARWFDREFPGVYDLLKSRYIPNQNINWKNKYAELAK